MEDERYHEVVAELKRRIQQQQFTAGGLLRQVKEERLFGNWGNFRDFVMGELRLTEPSAYRLMFAHEMLVLLEVNGCLLPTAERQIRPLKLLKEDSLRVKAWKRACKMKQRSTPTHVDVMQEVTRLLDPKLDESTDKVYREYRQHLELVKTGLARASQILADGDLEKFLLCTDPVSARQQRTLARLLQKAGTEMGDHFKRFKEFL